MLPENCYDVVYILYPGWGSFEWSPEVFKTFARTFCRCSWNPSPCLRSVLPQRQETTRSSGTLAVSQHCTCKCARLMINHGATWDFLVSLLLVFLNAPNDPFLEIKCGVGTQAVKKQLVLDPSSPDVHRCLVGDFGHLLFSSDIRLW